jgi:regulator of cell morphogenesis and NO signaling
MNPIDPNLPVGRLVADRPAAARVLERHGIDYCCGGQQPLDEACRARGLDPTSVLAELTAEAAEPRPAEEAWDELPLGLLLDHILETHHEFLWREMPRLRALLDKVEAKHGSDHPDLFPEVGTLVRRLFGELDPHMMKEEEILFPAIRSLEAGRDTPFGCGAIEGPVQVMEMEHEQAGEVLRRLREVTHGYEAPADACPSFRALYAGLADLEADLHRHIHLENHFVHPRALQL